MSVDKQQSSVAAKAQEQAVLSRLQQVPLFARLPSKYIQFIRKAAAPTPIAEGQVLCSEGDEPSGLYILFKGNRSRPCVTGVWRDLVVLWIYARVDADCGKSEGACRWCRVA